ncbi:hypothetical protein FRB93_010358 [Tulasnella sp. JGI-2019a]|nr:hypothetical protein FRB93_010358 [Tulasnella sp. JGI-2019a]
MSSEEDVRRTDDVFEVLTGLGDIPAKRKRVSRACDICRRKKLRCDAHGTPTMTKCSHCFTFKLDCTFVEGAKRRTPPKGYIHDLEERIDMLEKLIRRVMPHIDIDAEVGPSFNQDTWETVKGASQSTRLFQPSAGRDPSASTSLQVLADMRQVATPLKNGRSLLSGLPPRPVITGASATPEDDEGSGEENILMSNDGTVAENTETRMGQLYLGDTTEKIFLGKSSAVPLVLAARDLKQEVPTNTNITFTGCKYPPVIRALRSQFWKPSPWELVTAGRPTIESLQFPPSDLIRTLIDLCFSRVMPLMPLLHRPSFEQQYAEGRAGNDFDFARLLLLVCAVGSRYCDDMRLCLISPTGEVEWHSAGWIYFAQVYQMPKPLFSSAKLVELQIIALSATYLEGTSAWLNTWLINGSGLRFAEENGAHREKVYAPTQAFENQMWKRAFWCLVHKDREHSAAFGRPINIYDEDVDVQLPLEVDDGGWDETKQAWEQPTGKSSQLAYFTQHSKLMKILAHCMKTLYSIRKPKVHLSFIGLEEEQDKVAELDSALNGWLDALPDHLKWDPHMNSDFYKQAAALRVTFHYVQIMAHRPFIQLSHSSKRRPSPSSLAVCANAARSCANVLDAFTDMPPSALFTTTALQSGVILMISIWEARRSGLNVDVSRQATGVKMCLKYLKQWEHRHYLSGRLYDVLRQTVSVAHVATVQHLNRPEADQLPSAKRARDQEIQAPDHEHHFEAVPDVFLGNFVSQYAANFASGSASSDQRPTAPSDGAHDTSYLSSIGPTWEDYPLFNPEPGMMPFQGMPGYSELRPMEGAVDSISPDSLWRELLWPPGSEENIGGNI